MNKTLSATLLSLGTAPAVAGDCVALVHGLGRSSMSMLVMGHNLKKDGFDPILVDYPSRTETVPDLAQHMLDEVRRGCPENKPVHFVTHSMGGILLRYAAKHLPERMPENIGRTVMLSPPNKGSEIVDAIGEQKWFQMTNGPAGAALGTSDNDWPARLGAFPHELGVIAGSQSIEPYFSALIDGADDGKVSVESTKLEGMRDHITLPVTHTFMMQSPDVLRQVRHFLTEGKFQRED